MYKNNKNQQPQQEEKKGNSFVKYTSLGFQMVVTIGLCTWAGVTLDEHYQKENLYTVIFSLLGVFTGLYFAIKGVIE